MADQTLTVEDLEDSQEFRSTDTSKEEVSFEDDFQETHHHVTSEDIVRQYKEQSKPRSNHGNNNNGYHHQRKPKQRRLQDNAGHSDEHPLNQKDITRSRQEQRTPEDARRTPVDVRTRGRHLEEEYDSHSDGHAQDNEGIQKDMNENGPNNHHHHDDDDDNREFFEYLDSFGEDGERLTSSSDAEVDDNAPKVIHLDHVDYILDNIDAELSHLINKSMVKTVYATPKSKSNYPGSERSQGKQTMEVRHGGNKAKRSNTGHLHHHHHRDGTDEGTEDTGLGSGSHIEEIEDNNNTRNGTRKSSRHHHTKETRTSTPLKIPIIEVSDADSVTSEEVQVRLQETLRKHNITPKPTSARRGSNPKSYGGQMSDPESIKTEEFERHFRGLVIKQVAGVPVRNFDAVTISSDLDSVRTTDVYHKFQDALHRGGNTSKGGASKFNKSSDSSDDSSERNRSTAKQRKLQRAKRVMDSDSDQDSESLNLGRTDSRDSVQSVPGVSVRDIHGNIGGEKKDDAQTHKRAKRAREKEKEQRVLLVASANQSPLRKLLSPGGSPRKSRSFPDIMTPKGGSTPERSPSCSPPRTPTLLAPPPRFKDHSKLRQTRSFDETLRSRQGQQPQVYQWSDHYLQQRHSPKCGSSRQDSVSTYEEVESLSSHQVSSTNSRSASEGPSRLPSFGSSGSSLDRSGEHALRWRFTDDLPPMTEKPTAISRSGSMGSSSPSHSNYSGSKHSTRSSVSDGTHSEADMQSDIAKWVDQTRVETARKHSDSKMADAEVIKSNEAPERSTQLQKHPSAPLLNMECGDVIAGSSVEQIQLPHETERELALRLRNTSPAPPLSSVFSRTASFDSSISSYSDIRSDIAWTPAEDVLMNLGFGGPDLGIPERFLTSWREKAYTRRMESVRKLLRSHSSQSEPDYFVPKLHMMEKVQEEPDLPSHADSQSAVSLPVPNTVKPSAPQPSTVTKETNHRQKTKVPSSPKSSEPQPPCTQSKHVMQVSCDVSTDTSDLPGVFHKENSKVPKVLPSQTSVERLQHYRKRLMKAATVSNFGKTLADMARNRKGVQPNMASPPPMPSDAQIQQDMQKRMNMVARKPRSSGRGRRNKYFVKQSSLPVSLETLPEEEELGKPRVHDMRSQRSISLDTDELFRHIPLKIVMEQPSMESREAMSRQGTCDIDIDEAIADVEVDQKLPDKIDKYLTVVKDIMESKDSGFENDPSQNGSPQHMSPQSGVDSSKIFDNVLSQKEQNVSSKTTSKIVHKEVSHTKHKPTGKENQKPGDKERLEDGDTHLGVNKDCLDVQSTSSRNSSRSDESMISENKSHSNSRRSSMSSEKGLSARPSLVDMQEVFCQTIEEDDDSVFLTSPVPLPADEEMVDCICMCTQTSPDLNSPPLSPLECGLSMFSQPDLMETNSKYSARQRVDSEGFTPVHKPAILVRTMSSVCSQASLDATEPLILDHQVHPIFNPISEKPYEMENGISDKTVEVENEIFTDANEKTSTEVNKKELQQEQDTEIKQMVQPVNDTVPQLESVKPSEVFAPLDDVVSTTDLPGDDNNSTKWPETGHSPTQEEMETFVQDTSAGFMSDTDCLPESEEEQLAEKVTQLRRRRSLRPEWATPEKRSNSDATGSSSQIGGSSSDGSEVSVGKRTKVKLHKSVKKGSEVKSDQDDRLSDSESRKSGASTSDVLSVVTDKWGYDTEMSSPSSVYRYAQFMNANQDDDDKPSDLIRSNSDLLKRLNDFKSTLSSLATPRTPLKRSLSVEALNPYYMRPRTLSERGPRQSEMNLIDSCKHPNTLQGSASTGGYKSRIKMPMNTPEVLKLASMKLERLIHKGSLRPVTFNESFQEEDPEEVTEQDNISTKLSHSLQSADSKQANQIRDDHISLPDNKGVVPPSPFLYPSPTSDKPDKDRQTHVRQNSNFSDRSHGSSDKSLQSPSTRPPSVPSILTKGPTLESSDSLEVICLAQLGDEKRPPLRSRDFCSWSSRSSTPSLLAIPAFHSPDLPDFESRPRTSSPSDFTPSDKPKPVFTFEDKDIELNERAKSVEEHIEKTTALSAQCNGQNAKSSSEKDTLDMRLPSTFIHSPISPRKLELLFTDTPPSTDNASSLKGDHNDDDNNGDGSNTEQYFSSTHHEMRHTIPLPKLTVNENGNKVPTILHELATIPTIVKGKQFTIHLEVPPLNYQEMNNNDIVERDEGKETSVTELDISQKDMLDVSGKECDHNWISEAHYRAPYYWDVSDSIPVFPLYRDGHFTSDVPNQHSTLIPRHNNAIMPSFDEICSKAGRLIQNLEQATTVVEGFQPVDPAPSEPDGRVARQQNGSMEGTMGNPHTVVVINVVDHEEENKMGFNSNQDTEVIKNEEEAIEEETIRMSQAMLQEGAPSPVSSAISKAQKKNLTENQQRTPPDWGAKLESLANLEELMETEKELRVRLSSMEKSFDEVKNHKQLALKELKTLHDAVHRNKADIQKAEEMTAKNVERADGIRSELMVLEYQRDQARRELKDLEESIHARHGSPGIDQSHGNSWTNNASDQELLNVTANEVREIIQERDELKSRLRRGHGDLSPVERSELQRQLSATKADLFNEQKSSRVKIDQLEEELEESHVRIDQLSKQKLDLSTQVEQLNESLDSAEEHSTKQEQTDKLREELDHLQTALQDKDEYIVAAKASVREKEQAVTKQREELMKVKRQLAEVKEMNETLMQERKEDFDKLNMDKALAIDETRDVLKREHKLAIDQLRINLDKDRKEALARQEEKLQEQMAVKHSLLLTKGEELILLKEDMKHLKRSAEQDEEERALTMQKKIEEAVEKAKEMWEEEMGKNKRREQAIREEEFAKETARLHEEIRKEKMMTDNTKATIAALKEEIAELQEKRLAAGREKVEAVSEARDATRQEMQAEWDSLRQQLTQEKNSEVAILKEKMVQKDEELEKLRSEVKKRVEQQVAADTIDKTSSRGIVAEINEECKQTATIMATHKNINSLKNDKHSKSPSSNRKYVNGYHGSTSGRTQVLAALTNLRSSNEELRNYVHTVKDDLEKQKKMVAKLQKDKDAEAQSMQEKLKQGKSEEAMKNKLVKDHLKVVDELQKTVHSLQSNEAGLHQKLLNKDEELREIQRGMAKWKEESAYKMAQKFEEELSRELDIRLQEKEERQELLRSGPKSMDSSQESHTPSSVNTPPTDASTIPHLRKLQERVRHLQAENISLRKNGRTPQMDKSPQLSQNEVEEKEQHIYQLQQKVMLLDRQLHIAEDRCRDNAAHLSEKSSETSKLQSALAQQTKELMRMERAYAKISQSVRRPPFAL